MTWSNPVRLMGRVAKSEVSLLKSTVLIRERRERETKKKEA